MRCCAMSVGWRDNLGKNCGLSCDVRFGTMINGRSFKRSGGSDAPPFLERNVVATSIIPACQPSARGAATAGANSVLASAIHVQGNMIQWQTEDRAGTFVGSAADKPPAPASAPLCERECAAHQAGLGWPKRRSPRSRNFFARAHHAEELVPIIEERPGCAPLASGSRYIACRSITKWKRQAAPSACLFCFGTNATRVVGTAGCSA